ncbi:MAG: sodium:solute symporter family protein [Verrucomicrobia bacterium]|nr:sodium:solute symporter family protein [Verrucomicrobiota bacterium]
MTPDIRPSISLPDILTAADWLVFGLVIVVTVAAVLLGHYRKRHSIQSASDESNFLDLLIMGRQLTLPLFVATLVATWYGGIFGVTEIAFNHGMFNLITQGVFWYATYIIFALFIVHRISAYQAVTLPDLVTRMFGPRAGTLSAVFNFFNVLPIAYVISIGIVLQLLFGGPLWLMMTAGTLLVLLYSLWGGLRAVVYSDLIQFVVMCGAVLLVLVVSVNTYGGMRFLTMNLPSSHLTPTGGQGWGVTLVWGFIALATLVDPNFYQRCFAATSTRTARRGILISTAIWIAFDICTTFGAMYARAVIPEADPHHAYLLYAVQLLPSGFRGFLLAGIAATILSTLDSYLFLAGVTLAYDLAPKRLRGRIGMHHVGTITAGALAVILGVCFRGNIKAVWQTLGSYATACMLLPMMAGYIFPGRIRDNQFVCASLCGMLGTTYWRLAPHHGFWMEVDALYVGALSTAAGIVLYELFCPYRHRRPTGE